MRLIDELKSLFGSDGKAEDGLWAQLQRALEDTIKARAQVIGNKQYAPCAYNVSVPIDCMRDLSSNGLADLFASELASFLAEYIAKNHYSVSVDAISVRLEGKMIAESQIEVSYLPVKRELRAPSSSISRVLRPSDDGVALAPRRGRRFPSSTADSEADTILAWDEGDTIVQSQSEGRAFLEVVRSPAIEGFLPGSRMTIQSLPVTIGRGRSRKHGMIAVPSQRETRFISRYHSMIEEVDNCFYLTDLGSSNCTFLDGQKLERHIRQPLADGMLITIADCLEFRFRVVGDKNVQTHEHCETGDGALDPSQNSGAFTGVSTVSEGDSGETRESLLRLTQDIVSEITLINRLYVDRLGPNYYVFRHGDKDQMNALALLTPADTSDAFSLFLNSLRTSLIDRTRGAKGVRCGRLPLKMRDSRVCMQVCILRNERFHQESDVRSLGVLAELLGERPDPKCIPYIRVQTRLLEESLAFLKDVYEYGKSAADISTAEFAV